MPPIAKPRKRDPKTVQEALEMMDFENKEKFLTYPLKIQKKLLEDARKSKTKDRVFYKKKAKNEKEAEKRKYKTRYFETLACFDTRLAEAMEIYDNLKINQELAK